MAKPHAAIYVRVSTEDQKSGLSTDVQKQLSVKRAVEAGYEVLEILDDSGLSGFKEDRPGIIRIKELIEAGKVSAVVALSSDRLYRNSRAHQELMEQIFARGIQLLYVHQGSPENNAPGKLSDGVLSLVNQFYRDQVSDKVKATLYAKAAAGYYPCMPPPGYVNARNPKASDKFGEKIIVPDPVMGSLVTELFHLYASGLYSVYDLADHLSRRGLMSRYGKPLSASRLYDLLKNRLYIGEVSWGTVRGVKGKHESLTDEDTFNRVQEVMMTHNRKACRRRKYTWLLAGFLMCAVHKRRCTAEWHLNKKLAYYHCPNRFGCGKYMEMTAIEDTVAEEFKKLEFSQEFIDLVIEKTREQFMAKRKRCESKKYAFIARRTALEQKRKAAEDKLLAGALPDDAFARQRAEIEKNLSNIGEDLIELEKGKIVDVDVAKEVLVLTKDLYRTYKAAPHEIKRQYLGFFWERFEVKDGAILKSTPSPLFSGLVAAEEAFYASDKDGRSTDLKGLSDIMLDKTQVSLIGVPRKS